MQLTNVQKDKTTQKIYGKWIFEDNKIKTTILITELEVSLINGKSISETFKNNCEWSNDFLIFTGANSKYYIKHADEKNMFFGEFTFPRSLIKKWEIKFQRIHN